MVMSKFFKYDVAAYLLLFILALTVLSIIQNRIEENAIETRHYGQYLLSQ